MKKGGSIMKSEVRQEEMFFKSESGKEAVLNRYKEILSKWPVDNKQ